MPHKRHPAAQQSRVTPSAREVPMRKYHHMVPSLGPLLFILALLATMGCDGDPSSDPGADRGDVGPAPDAATADRATPPEDHPVVTSDAGSNDAADASTPPDASSPDVVMPPPDVTPPEDHVTPPDAGPYVCEVGTMVRHVEGRLDSPCTPRIPPGMAVSEFACQRTCDPTSVYAYQGATHTTQQITCDVDATHNVFYANLDVAGLPGMYPCIDHMCIRYVGPSEQTIGFVWDNDCISAAVYSWAPGVNPATVRGERMMDMPRVVVSSM